MNAGGAGGIEHRDDVGDEIVKCALHDTPRLPMPSHVETEHATAAREHRRDFVPAAQIGANSMHVKRALGTRVPRPVLGTCVSSLFDQQIERDADEVISL